MCGRAKDCSEHSGSSEYSRQCGQTVQSAYPKAFPEESSGKSEKPGKPDGTQPKKKTGVAGVAGIAAMFLLVLIKGYRYGISPLFPPCCRYVPTCSEYAVEAISRYGALRGGRLALCRLLRCHPFAAGGYDPVE